MTRNRFRIEQVVMTEEYGERRTPLRDWLIWSTLTAFYRSAVRRSLSDRYERKLEAAEGELRKRAAAMRRAGIPIVMSPLPCPGAVHAPWSGSVDALEASVFSVGSGAALTLYYAASFTSAGAESALSQTGSIGLASGESFTLSAEATAPEYSVTSLATADGWWPWLGTSANKLRRVGAQALTLSAIVTDGRASATQWAGGALPSNGQVANAVVPYRDLILRG
jgi:hypothetical protein